jgi:hypothetical protein
MDCLVNNTTPTELRDKRTAAPQSTQQEVKPKIVVHRRHFYMSIICFSHVQNIKHHKQSPYNKIKIFIHDYTQPKKKELTTWSREANSHSAGQ